MQHWKPDALLKLDHAFNIILNTVKRKVPELSVAQARYLPEWLVKIKPAVTPEEAYLRSIFAERIVQGVLNGNLHPIFLSKPPKGPLNAFKHYLDIEDDIAMYCQDVPEKIGDESKVEPSVVEEGNHEGVKFIVGDFVPQAAAFVHISLMNPRQ